MTAKKPVKDEVDIPLDEPDTDNENWIVYTDYDGVPHRVTLEQYKQLESEGLL